MKARPYQVEAVRSIYDYFIKKQGNPIVAMPTGTGKSIVIADFIRSAFTAYPTTRIMMLTHVKELIEQNFEKLTTLWPTAPAGIYSSGLKRKDHHLPITFAGIASVAKKPTLFGHIDLLMIDECHLLSPKEETMYQKVINILRQINPYLKVIGLTATPYRLGQGLLTEDGLFTDICIDLTKLERFNMFIEEGYLSQLIPKRTAMTYSTEGIHTRGGEFVESEVQAAVDKSHLTYAACREMVELGHNRRSWLVFSSGIEHGKHIMEALDSMGVSVTMVHSLMHDTERDKNIADFKAGKYRCMVNNGILTTGFDHPDIDLIGVMRLTQSPGLHVQILGRGTRPVYAPGFDLSTKEGRLAAMAAGPKQNCLVLDFAGNTRRLGPINDPVIPKPKGKGGGGPAPIRICETCGTINHAAATICIGCGQEFPRQLKINTQAYTDEVIRTGVPEVVDFDVSRVTYVPREKADRPTTLQVTYYCGLRMFREWVCFEHTGYARTKAEKWWAERSVARVPSSVSEAMVLLNTLRTPKQIKVWINKQHPDVLSSIF